MGGKVEVLAPKKSYNRLLNGPTWGLATAARLLALLARERDVSPSFIKLVFQAFPTLNRRLQNSGFKLVEIKRGTSKAEITHALRLALYSSVKIGRLTQAGFTVLAGNNPAFPLLGKDVAKVGDELNDQKSLELSRENFYWAAQLAQIDRLMNGQAGEEIFGAFLLLLTAGGAYLGGHYDFPSRLAEELTGNWAIWVDGIVGGAVGFTLDIAAVVAGRRAKEKNHERVADIVWYYLNWFAAAEGRDLSTADYTRVKDFLSLVEPPKRQAYLNFLSAEKLSHWPDKLNSKEVRAALVARPDAQPEELEALLSYDVGPQAYGRIKDQLSPKEKLEIIALCPNPMVRLVAYYDQRSRLTPAEFKMLLLHQDLKIRRDAYAQLAGVAEAELDSLAPQMVNIPALFSHPLISYGAKVAALKATILRENISEIVATRFLDTLAADDIRQIYTGLITANLTTTTKPNIKLFEEALVSATFTPPDILCEIAMFDNGRAVPAFRRLVGEGGVQLDKTTWSTLKNSASAKVKVLAYFLDPAESLARRAEALWNYTPKTDQRAVGSHQEEDQNYYEADHGRCIPISGKMITVSDYADAYSTADLKLALEILSLRPEAEQKQIVTILREGISTSELGAELWKFVEDFPS